MLTSMVRVPRNHFQATLILIYHEHTAPGEKTPQGERRCVPLAHNRVARRLPSVHPTGVFRFHALASPLKISTYPEHTARSLISSSPRTRRCSRSL